MYCPFDKRQYRALPLLWWIVFPKDLCGENKSGLLDFLVAPTGILRLVVEGSVRVMEFNCVID